MLFTYLASVQRKPTKRGIYSEVHENGDLFRPAMYQYFTKLIIYTLSDQRYSLL